MKTSLLLASLIGALSLAHTASAQSVTVSDTAAGGFRVTLPDGRSAFATPSLNGSFNTRLSDGRILSSTPSLNGGHTHTFAGSASSWSTSPGLTGGYNSRSTSGSTGSISSFLSSSDIVRLGGGSPTSVSRQDKLFQPSSDRSSRNNSGEPDIRASIILGILQALMGK